MNEDHEFQQKLLETYKLEAEEHLNEMAEMAVHMEASAENDEYSERLYRATHSLKGAARAVGESEVELACQALESILARARDTGRVLTAAELDSLNLAIAGVHSLSQHTERSSLEHTLAVIESISLEESDPVREPISGPNERAEPEPAETEGTPAGDAPAAKTDSSETVRLPAARIERLMSSAEELLTVKQMCERMQSRLESLESRMLRMGVDLNILLEARDIRTETAASSRSAAAVIDTVRRELRDSLIVPIRGLLRTYAVVSRNLARELGKRVDVSIEDGGVEIDKRIVDSIGDGLTHIIRNCVDHGLESPDARESAGKPPKGTIRFQVLQHQPGRVLFSISDDGAGIDFDALRARLSTVDDATDEQVVDRVFEASVSTKETPTLLSGRGMGLAIVREQVEGLGGSVDISSVRGSGTTVSLDLPTHLSRYQGVLVQCGKRHFIIPTIAVRRVYSTTDPKIKHVANGTSVIMDDVAVRATSLSQLLGLDVHRITPQVHLVVVSSGSDIAALLVDGVVGDMEIVVRSLGPFSSQVSYIAGAAVMGDGEIVPVLNVAQVVAAAMRFVQTPTVDESSPGPEHAARNAPPHVLVAEDSVTSRMLLRNVLETAGMRVSTAKDGVEALHMLSEGPFDVLVSDVDMPRMNGFVLTEKVRAIRSLQAIPVVLITALETDEDRQRGLAAGADRYMTKGGFDQGDLIQTIRRLV